MNQELIYRRDRHILKLLFRGYPTAIYCATLDREHFAIGDTFVGDALHVLYVMTKPVVSALEFSNVYLESVTVAAISLPCAQATSGEWRGGQICRCNRSLGGRCTNFFRSICSYGLLCVHFHCLRAVSYGSSCGCNCQTCQRFFVCFEKHVHRVCKVVVKKSGKCG